jgi:glycosyltransferase involved in cell wall biosynthesis
MHRVTFGITTFDRPQCLKKLVASIREFYPEVPILIADNGKRGKPIQDCNTIRGQLPFDVGPAACRNWLMRVAKTEYVLILDDDFVFQAETKIECLVEILDAFPHVGAVGGALDDIVRNPQVTSAMDIDGLTIVNPKSPEKMLPSGVRYQYCDYVRLFVLLRKRIIETTPWDRTIKIGGEHFMFFYELLRKGVWRVTWTPDVIIRHEMFQGTSEYKRFRARGSHFEQEAMQRMKSQRN